MREGYFFEKYHSNTSHARSEMIECMCIAKRFRAADREIWFCSWSDFVSLVSVPFLRIHLVPSCKDSGRAAARGRVSATFRTRHALVGI